MPNNIPSRKSDSWLATSKSSASVKPVSKGVRDRLHRSRFVIIAGYVYADLVVEAWNRRLNEFLFGLASNGRWTRLGQWLASTQPTTGNSQLGPGDMFRFIAGDIEDLGKAMVHADDLRARCRARRRQAMKHRNRHAKQTYRELSRARKLLNICLGTRQTRNTLGLQGPTPRDPNVLLTWARSAAAVLADPEQLPACSFANGGKLNTCQLAERLESCYAALQEAIEVATESYWAEAAAIENRRLAIAAFDGDTQRGARVLETFLDVLGLPSLALTVRPGVKRRGRPPRRAPIDAYPDLVEQVLGDSTIEQPSILTTMAEPATSENSNFEVSDRSANIAVESATKTSPGKIGHTLHKASSGGPKIKKDHRKPGEGNRKIESGIRKLSEAEQKTEKDHRKRGLDHLKRRNLRRKTLGISPSPLSRAFRNPESIQRRRRRIVHGRNAVDPGALEMVDDRLEQRSRRHDTQ